MDYCLEQHTIAEVWECSEDVWHGKKHKQSDNRTVQLCPTALAIVVGAHSFSM